VTTPASHPGNDYYVNAVTHTIQRQGNSLLANALKASGWLGPYSWLQAKGAANGLAAAAPATPGGLPLGGIAAIGDFFNKLTEANTWVRVGEFAAGAILLYIGLSALTRGTAAGDAVQSATSKAKKVAAVIPK
jgi:hypothetical protein